MRREAYVDGPTCARLSSGKIGLGIIGATFWSVTMSRRVAAASSLLSPVSVEIYFTLQSSTELTAIKLTRLLANASDTIENYCQLHIPGVSNGGVEDFFEAEGLVIGMNSQSSH